ncbi:MAG: immunoglobulin domain-containing protein [Phycisphaerales bacterium]|nr:immunoglobulin domain-containing protein [Phycisphaerales bacterium]
MSSLKPGFCLTVLGAALGSGVALAAENWKLSGGAMHITLDEKAFSKLALDMPVDARSGQANGEIELFVNGADSNFGVTTDNGRVLMSKGHIRAAGEANVHLGIEAPGELTTLADFVIQINGQYGTITDQVGLGKHVFEFAPGTLSVKVTQAAGQVEIAGELQLTRAMGRILDRPELAGQPVGSFRAVGSIVPSDEEPGMGGIAGGTGNGPDVIVSTIGSTITDYAKVGTIMPYAFTTVSCNLGEADAIWIDCTSGSNCNQHPVISQNMYRLKGGRFEQIGMSWLKHGFCAADAPSCGSPYESNGSCDWLGTHATDTYSASLNAQQSNLGPRSEVNPWTGVFPYPYIRNWNLSGNAIYKRLQIQQDDLNPAMNSGALYYAESQYIPTDEQPINRYNNLAYRRITVGTLDGTTQSYNLAFSGSTFAQQPAINAWRAADAAVTLVNADVANDGRFILGYKVTDNGNGTWTYEFAILNMNADAAGQAFQVPVGAGATISNIGFHDVDYHSGEPYSGTDWSSSVSGGFVKWETQKMSENTNANALRWGSLYNFRFDADAAPTAGDVSLSLFKISGTLAIPAVGVSAACIAPSIDTEPGDTTVDLGDPVNFTVTVSGSAPLSYQWFKDGDAILGAESATYSIAAAAFADAGDYDVLVTNLCGNAQSTSVSLTVVQPCMKGDANCDGVVNNFDIDFFVAALLLDVSTYTTLGGSASCWDIRDCWGDLNGIDGLNNFDIDPFVACIIAPPTPGDPCP